MSLLLLSMKKMNWSETFSALESDLKCSLGCDSNEDQEHLLRCSALKTDNDVILNYNDIYSNDQIQIKRLTKTLMKKYEQFIELTSTVHRTSPQTVPIAATSDQTINDDNIVTNVNSVDDSVVELD